MKYKVIVLADNSGYYAGNGLTFDSIVEAVSYARNLASRWILVRDWCVIPADQKPDVGSFYSESYAQEIAIGKK